MGENYKIIYILTLSLVNGFESRESSWTQVDNYLHDWVVSYNSKSFFVA